ncbi:MAG: hypothetical protein ACKOCB_07155 [Planctomycetia bacterium]
MPVTSTRRLPALAGLCLMALLVACGTGGSSTTTTQFWYAPMGIEGGTATAGPATLVVPPGALAQPTALAMMPESVPLPVQDPAGLPCTTAPLPGRVCIGPVGLALQVPARLVMRYEPASLPSGVGPGDLVLLVSDPGTDHTTLVPLPAGQVQVDAIAHTLSTTAYSTLGYVALGVRTCVLPDILAEDSGLLPPNPNVAGGAAVTDLWAITLADPSSPALLPLSGYAASAWAPSPSGSRVLLYGTQPLGGPPVLATLAIPVTGAPSVAIAAPLASGDMLVGSDGLYGWVAGAMTDTVFGVLEPGTVFTNVKPQPQGLPVPQTRILLQDTSGGPAPTVLWSRDSSWLLDDLRQSTDGVHVVVRWFPNVGLLAAPLGQVATGVDVLTLAGVPRSQDLVPAGSGTGDPRFEPASDRLTVVQPGNGLVLRWDAQGTSATPLLPALGPNDGATRVGFALAPGQATYAEVRVESVALTSLVTQATIATGVLPGTPVDGLMLTASGLDELVWHPSGQAVFVDLKDRDVLLLRISPSGLITGVVDLPAASMSTVDVHRVDGRILVTVPPGTNSNTFADGLWVFAADGSSPQAVPTPTLAGPRMARWVRTWRTTPGSQSPRVR